MKNNAKYLKFLFLIMISLITRDIMRAQDYIIYGTIESRRKDKIVSIIFKEIPAETRYLIVNDNKVAGSVNILNTEKIRESSKTLYRSFASFSLENDYNESDIRSGMQIGLVKQKPVSGREYTDPIAKEVIIYKKLIITEKDNREMVLVSGGKFLFGSNNGNKDEAPEQMLDLPDFYIDKYEVSNREYLRFIAEAKRKPPPSWTGGMYKSGEEDFPVIVNYYDAVEYAKWAAKRLPAEQEWEKAARGSGFEVIKEEDGFYIKNNPIIYPWGNVFDPERCNSADFWDNLKTGQDIKKVYKKGFLPVRQFEGRGDSPYGAVNMAGNAMEWTLGWYRAYKESKYHNSKFGTQFKVLRGGCYFSSSEAVRTTDRQIGGIPNLYSDPVGGIRCIKNPSVIDKAD